jgi:hypothetical protein
LAERSSQLSTILVGELALAKKLPGIAGDPKPFDVVTLTAGEGRLKHPTGAGLNLGGIPLISVVSPSGSLVCNV